MVILNPQKMELDEWREHFDNRRDELKYNLKELLKQHEPLFKNFHVGKKIGSGGFGTVFQLKQGEGTKPSSVVKVIIIPDDKEAQEIYHTGRNGGNMNKMLDEIVSRVSHEVKILEQFREQKNIVKIIASENVKLSRTFNAILIQMEYLLSLKRFFYDVHPLNMEREVIKLGIHICSALEALNKADILHRDVKPDNLFVNSEGTFKLGDFGIARYVREMTELTQIGTYEYTAPEVIYRDKVGANNKVDMYALGLVLYELLNLREIPGNRVKMPPPRSGSPTLKKIVLKSCAFKPEERFGNITQMKEELLSIF